MVRAALVVVVVAALVLLAAWGLQRRLVYLPSGTVPPVTEVLPGGRQVGLTTADGVRLGAWLVPPRGGDRRLAVLVASGNAGNRSLRAPLADALAAAGLTVLLLDYRGYGGNPGSPTEEGLARDVAAAQRFLVRTTGLPPDRVLYYGESLGAAVVTRLARTRPPGGLVLRSPFVDLAAVGAVHYPLLPLRLLLRDEYPLVDELRHVHVPVTVVYGTGDAVVPPEQSRAVAAAAPRLADVVRVPGADHNDRVLLDGRPVVRAVLDLAETVAAASSRRAP